MYQKIWLFCNNIYNINVLISKNTVNMPKSKINVTSNKLDQAPKTRAAGYGKVVDSMRDEMTEALNGVNVPKILSNKSDQAPKTRAAGYEENVLKPLQQEIDSRMNMLFMNWSDRICNYVNNFLNREENEFISNCIVDLKPWDSLAFEIKREKIKGSGGFQKAVWHPAFFWDFNDFLHNFYYNSEVWQLRPWEISTAIIVKKDENDPYLLNIHAEQLEYPGEWSLLMDWLFFHNSNVKDDEFNEIIRTPEDESKKETKELLKKNIKEEMEIEENEAKKEKVDNKKEKVEEKPEETEIIDEKIENEAPKPEKNQKKSLGETIKWWFK